MIFTTDDSTFSSSISSRTVDSASELSGSCSLFSLSGVFLSALNLIPLSKPGGTVNKSANKKETAQFKTEDGNFHWTLNKTNSFPWNKGQMMLQLENNKIQIKIL
jgi:hypothetical protein